MKRLAAVVAVVLFSAALLAAPASAHSNYDGDPRGEGNFWYTAQHGPNSSLTIGADDTKSDGHCVYINAYRAGSFVGQAYSCGAPVTKRINGPGTYQMYICITGHWDCDYWTQKVVIG